MGNFCQGTEYFGSLRREICHYLGYKWPSGSGNENAVERSEPTYRGGYLLSYLWEPPHLCEGKERFPGLPVHLSGSGALLAAFLNESRIRGRVLRSVQEIRVQR